MKRSISGAFWGTKGSWVASDQVFKSSSRLFSASAFFLRSSFLSARFCCLTSFLSRRLSFFERKKEGIRPAVEYQPGGRTNSESELSNESCITLAPLVSHKSSLLPPLASQEGCSAFLATRPEGSFVGVPPTEDWASTVVGFS